MGQSYALCSTNGKQIHLVDEQNSRVECLVVHGSYIQDVGDLEKAFTNLLCETWVHHCAGNILVFYSPQDSHAHILEYGASRLIPLEQGQTIKEVVTSVRDYIVSDPDIFNNKSKVVQGWGWDHTVWPEGRWPNADDLDADPIVHGRPVILQSKDGHAIWVSRATLNDNGPYPEHVEGGVIETDSDGNPNGVFLDNAQDLIHKPEATDADLNGLFTITVRDALASGLTSIHDCSTCSTVFSILQKIRIYGMTYFNESGEYWGDRIAPLVNAGNGRLHCRSVKMFADGALRTGGAALYEPYTDNPSTNGVMRMPPELINRVIPRFLQDGWQVVRDRANGIVLDAFEKALSDVDVATLRPRLEHGQLLTEADMKRVGELGVIASVQPTHVIDDMWYAEERLGPERVKGLYAFRSLLDNKAKITLGSDAPVEGINPLAGFYAAITRLSADGTSPHGPDGWFPKQRLTRREALRGMTIDPAYASFTETTLGSLVPGKRADFVILSQDIMSVAVDKILETKVVATLGYVYTYRNVCIRLGFGFGTLGDASASGNNIDS
ncbi:amidohydrolase family-domain-containing protein [Desarmillaria tabescens]|uniref:Amidohydrolase family-domain-containing protein n=1 Tax=Armillaria tabescens TaxID=1929756 RepID=A0AA39N8T2_ARMTA|nr:amidohydrolase family-domain-containing protein [Desarmillaria tabescens]KAK0461124.1 amidohydrolase family-domain-containing protein [Desarmillaria tabescens]